MERYEKYKDSGVEWIGEIPEGWEVGLLKRYCHVTDGSHFSPKSQMTGKPYVSVKDVGVNYINFHGAGYKPSPLGGNVFSQYFLSVSF